MTLSPVKVIHILFAIVAISLAGCATVPSVYKQTVRSADGIHQALAHAGYVSVSKFGGTQIYAKADDASKIKPGKARYLPAIRIESASNPDGTISIRASNGIYLTMDDSFKGSGKLPAEIVNALR